MAGLMLFHIQSESEDFWVEANSFGSAIKHWKEHIFAENPGEHFQDLLPESVVLISRSPVIRGNSKE